MPDPNVGSANPHRFVIPHERGTLAPITRWVNGGLLRYVDERKTPAFRHSSGLRLPRVSDVRQGYGKRIFTGADLFKYRASYSRKTPFGLYSALARAVEQAPKKMDGAKRGAWKIWIQANAPKLGVTANEIHWSGVIDWLAGYAGRHGIRCGHSSVSRAGWCGPRWLSHVGIAAYPRGAANPWKARFHGTGTGRNRCRSRRSRIIHRRRLPFSLRSLDLSPHPFAPTSENPPAVPGQPRVQRRRELKQTPMPSARVIPSEPTCPFVHWNLSTTSDTRHSGFVLSRCSIMRRGPPHSPFLRSIRAMRETAVALSKPTSSTPCAGISSGDTQSSLSAGSVANRERRSATERLARAESSPRRSVFLFRAWD